MHDIREMLERWGVWCRDNHEAVSWYKSAPGFGYMLTRSHRVSPSLSDDDALAISRIIARLGHSHRDSCDILIEYYVMLWSLKKIGAHRQHSAMWASKRLDIAEQLAGEYFQQKIIA